MQYTHFLSHFILFNEFLCKVGSKCLEAAWAGGRDGREVMDRLFPQIPLLLSEHGVFYLLALKENKPSKYKTDSFLC